MEYQAITTVELKYCERCGNLWLRRAGHGENFCAPCASFESRQPVRRKRAAAQRDNDGKFATNELLASAGQWMNASGLVSGEAGRA